MAVRRVNGGRGLRRDGRPTGHVRPRQGPQARVPAKADGTAVVRHSVGSADGAGQRHGRSENGRPGDRQAEAAGGAAAHRAQDGPAVPQRDTRVSGGRAFPHGTPAGRGPPVRPAVVCVRSKRLWNTLARGRHRAGGPACQRLFGGPQRGTRFRRPSCVHGLRALGRGDRGPGPVPRHVVHGQTEEPGGVPQTGGQLARGPMGRGRLAYQGQRAQVAGHAGL